MKTLLFVVSCHTQQERHRLDPTHDGPKYPCRMPSHSVDYQVVGSTCRLTRTYCDLFLNTEAQRAQRDVFDFTNQPPPSVEIGLTALPALVPLCVLCVSVFPIRFGSA
jgi:hypothetical protein